MNYLIVMPQVTKIKTRQYGFPMGITYVSSSLKATGRNVFTLNLNYKDESIMELLKKAIESNKIDVVATGGLTTQYPQLKTIIDSVKTINPQIITIVGGGIITSDPIPAMQALETVDYGVVGEGEITICELAEVLENSRTINTVDGLIYHKDDAWILTNPRAEIMDLDTIPFPDYDGFEFSELLDKQNCGTFGYSDYGRRTAPVVFSRSCPFKCTFCFHSSGSVYRQRSLDSIFQEIDMLVAKYGIKNLGIADELFAYDLKRVEEFCQRIKPYNLKYMVLLRVDMVTREILQLLKDTGCSAVYFGLESADNRILKSMRKQITVEQIENALGLATEVALVATGTFIFGDLEETYETAMNTINWCLEHPQYTTTINWLLVFPGSHLYKVACERGIIKDKVQYIKDLCPVINVSKLSASEYKEIVARIDSMSCTETDFLSEAIVVPLSKSDKVNLHGKCPYCHQENLFENFDVFKNFSGIFCSHCNQSLKIMVADYIDNTFDNNIKKILVEKQIAIFPIIAAVVKMIEKAPSLMNEKVYLVDSASYKQENNFMGKTTKNPDIIKEKNIEVVIISTIYPSTAYTITSRVKENYPSVKHIIHAGELINPEFELSEKF